MVSFKFIISQKNKTYQIEKEQEQCPIIGKKISEIFSGDFLGLEGFEFQITGGSDKDGFPMRHDIDGTARKRLILKKGIGYSGIKKIKKKKFLMDGIRKMKSLRGNTISQDITQINCKVKKSGTKNLDELLTKKETEEKNIEKKN